MLHNKLCQMSWLYYFSQPLWVRNTRRAGLGWLWLRVSHVVTVTWGWAGVIRRPLHSHVWHLGREDRSSGGWGSRVSGPLLSFCGFSLQCGASEQPDSLHGHLRFQRCVFWTRQAEETPFPTWLWKTHSVASATFNLWRRSQKPAQTHGRGMETL